MSAGVGVTAPTEPPTLSRYRSLRGATRAPQPRKSIDATAMRESPPKGNGTVASLKSVFGSRYRRRPKADEAGAVSGSAPAVPPVPPLAQGPQNAGEMDAGYEDVPSVTTTIEAGPRRDYGPQTRRLHKAPPAPAEVAGESPTEGRRHQGSEWRGDEGSPESPRASRRKVEQESALYDEDEGRRLDAESLLAEQKRKDLERLQAQLEAATQRAPPPQQHKPRSPVLERFSFLTRRGRTQQQPSPLSPPLATPTQDAAPGHRVKHSEPVAAPRKSMSVEPDGRVVVPRTDAPISASNSGERRVHVRCRQSSFSLAVVADTTVVDVLFQCSDMMNQPINTASGIVIEHYGPLGLERRLRRYERIRDVLNSWDRDTQNSLLVLPSDASERDKDLELSSVRRTQEPPPGVVLQLYHSNRPGKWSKRYITLQESDGQVLSSRKPDANLSDKDTVSLCHLSDFDIYTPTEAQMRKHLKPPKKHCFAVKSQQKTTLFESLDHFVHFFCTEDTTVAQRFYAAVHAWRSWYLVNRRLQGGAATPKKTGAQAVESMGSPSRHKANSSSVSRPSLSNDGAHGHKMSAEIVSPRSNAAAAATGRERASVDVGREQAARAPATRHFSRPSRDIHSTLVRKAGVAAPAGTAREFSATGLLGDLYEEKKREAQTDDATLKESAFTEGPSLLNRRASTKAAAAPAAHSEEPFTEGPSLLNRMPSTRAPAMPAAVTHRKEPSAEEPQLPNRRPSTKTTRSAAAPEPAEPAGWFPSALEHSARTKTARQFPLSAAAPPSSSHHSPPSSSASHHLHHPHRPATAIASAAAANTSEKRSASSSSRQQPPEPLLSFEPEFREAPQWSREGRGRGVHAPAGVPLVDLAGSTWQPRRSQDDAELAAATQRLLRREDAGGGGAGAAAGGVSRSSASVRRPGTSGGAAAAHNRGRAATMTSRSGAAPPVPLLQGLGGEEGGGSRAFPLLGGRDGSASGASRTRSGTMRS